MAIDLNDPEVMEAVKSAGFVPQDEVKVKIEEANKNLEANRNDILEQLNGVKQKYKNIDVEAYEKLASDKRFEKIASEGFDAYERSLGGELQERLQAQQSDWMIKEQELLRKQEESEKRVSQYEQALRAETLKRKLGMALAHNELVDPLAVPEIERDALDQLDLDDKGNIVVIGDDGIPRQTADGPMREADWIKEMMSSKPYRFRGGQGGGNNRQHGLAGADIENMTPAEKIRAARKSGGR